MKVPEVKSYKYGNSEPKDLVKIAVELSAENELSFDQTMRNGYERVTGIVEYLHIIQCF